MFLSGLSVSDMRKLGWLFPESKESSFTDLWTSIDLDAIDLNVILQQGETMASLAAFTVGHRKRNTPNEYVTCQYSYIFASSRL